MTQSSTANPFDLFLALTRAWMPVGLAAPEQLTQSILPGWSLISVNQGNSSAPDTEQAIVAKASYGKQLGQIMDVLAVVLEEIKPTSSRPEDVEAIKKFKALVADVDKVKAQAAEARIARLRSDLESLEQHNRAEFRRQRQALIDFLAEHQGEGAPGASAS
jgi:hypothetical protein